MGVRTLAGAKAAYKKEEMLKANTSDNGGLIEKSVRLQSEGKKDLHLSNLIVRIKQLIVHLSARFYLEDGAGMVVFDSNTFSNIVQLSSWESAVADVDTDVTEMLEIQSLIACNGFSSSHSSNAHHSVAKIARLVLTLSEKLWGKKQARGRTECNEAMNVIAETEQ